MHLSRNGDPACSAWGFGLSGMLPQGAVEARPALRRGSVLESTEGEHLGRYAEASGELENYWLAADLR
jgi:hypothetical protein